MPSGSPSCARPRPPPAGRCRRCRPASGSSPASPDAADDDYALRGTPDQIRAEIAEWEALGVTHLALYFASVEPEAIVRDVEWFVREVAGGG